MYPTTCCELLASHNNWTVCAAAKVDKAEKMKVSMSPSSVACGVRCLRDRLSCPVLAHGRGIEERLHRDPDRVCPAIKTAWGAADPIIWVDAAFL